MSLATEVQQIKLETYDWYVGGEYIGLTKQGTFRVTINEATSPVDDVNEVYGMVKEFSKGFEIMIEATLKKSSFDTIGGIVLRNRARLILDGAKKAYALGQKIQDLVALSGEVLLHPSSAGSLADRAGDMKFWKGTIKAENMVIVGDRDDEQELAVKCSIYPDLSKPKHLIYGMLGDWSAQEVAPKTLFHAFEERMNFVPAMGVTGVSIAHGARIQDQVYAAFSSDSVITANINFVGGYSATATSLVFDNLNNPNAFIKDTVYRINNEYMQVTNIVYATSTTGTLTVIRGIWGKPSAAIADGDSIVLQENYGLVRATEYVAYLSSAPLVATVGDSAIAEDDQKKGVIHGLTTGTTNITASTTVGVTTVTTGNLVVTHA